MSQKVKVVLNRAGVGALLKGSEMTQFIGSLASEKASSLGPGYGSDVYHAPTRVIASVYTETSEAAQENMENNTLLKVTGA